MSTPFTTVPEPVNEGPFCMLTGNEYVSIPEIDSFGRVLSVTILHEGCCGLIELRGTPLIAPVMAINGVEADLTAMITRRTLESEWLPTFACHSDLILTAQIVAPPDHKGFCYILTVHRPATAVGPDDGPVQLELGLKCSWDYTGVRILGARPLPVMHVCTYDKWTRTVVAEALGPTPLFACAVGASTDLDRIDISESSLPSRGPIRHDAQRMALSKTFQLLPGSETALAFYFAFNREADGARTTNVHLRRLGWETLRSDTLRWISDRKASIAIEEGLVDDSSAVAGTILRNLLFNYFYATGKTIDTEEFVAVTSRSPRYYVSGAFWSRDALLWSLPALLLIDQARARDVLHFALTVGTRHVGDHAQYMDGRSLYPGFELDEAAAYLVALDEYIDQTGDSDLLRSPGILDGINRVIDTIEAWLTRDGRGTAVLCGTFLDPADDPVHAPFLTYCNMLLVKGWLAVADILDRMGGGYSAKAARITEDAACLRESLMKCSVAEGPFGPMHAWAIHTSEPFAADGPELADSPPGSLELIGHYGCVLDDESAAVLAATRKWIHSPSNPNYYEGPFGAPGCNHAPYPWPMAIANSILAETAEWTRSGRCDIQQLKKAIDYLGNVPMDQGYGCETVDSITGRVVTGAAMASGAGFLAYALWVGLKTLKAVHPPGVQHASDVSCISLPG